MAAPLVPDHPAPYSRGFMAIAAEILRRRLPYGRVLDPFAGIGGIFRLLDYLPDLRIDAVELQPKWAAADPRTIVGDALDLPFADATFDAVITSPTYANRLADTFCDGQPAKGYVRHTYTHCYGAPLEPSNSGRLQWAAGPAGEAYQHFHMLAWREARRVLRPGGLFLLNIKDHVRAGRRQQVTRWHVAALQELDFRPLHWCDVLAAGQRYGAHAGSRVPYESLILFELAKELS